MEKLDSTERVGWRAGLRLGTALCLAMAAGCSSPAPQPDESLHGKIGPGGGELVGAKGTPFEGVHVVARPDAEAVPERRAAQIVL